MRVDEPRQDELPDASIVVSAVTSRSSPRREIRSPSTKTSPT